MNCVSIITNIKSSKVYLRLFSIRNLFMKYQSRKFCLNDDLHVHLYHLTPTKTSTFSWKTKEVLLFLKGFFIIAWVHVGWFTETWFLKGVFVIKLQLSLKVVSLIAFHLHLKLFCCYTWLITCITVCIWHYEAISNLV